ARCKLVLAMRGNPEAEATLARIDAPMLAPVVEAMVAHEVGHCWRYVNGAWHTVPAGFVASAEAPPSNDPALTRPPRAVRGPRREPRTQLLRIVRKQALGDPDLQPAGLDACVSERTGHDRVELGAHELPRREADRQHAQRHARRLPLRKLGAGFPHEPG